MSGPVRRSMSVMLVALGLGGCRPEGRVAVPSCPGGAPVETNFYDELMLGGDAGEIGEAGGVTWVLGLVEEGKVFRHALAHLDRAGGLTITPLEMRVDIAATEGDHIWLFAARPTPRWTVVDVRDPDAPVVGVEVPLVLGVTEMFASGFAVGSRRAVVIQDGDHVVTIDTATGKAVGPPRALPEDFESLHIGCADDRCVVIGLVHRYDDERRRVVAVRVQADGAVVAEPLSPPGIEEPFAEGQGGRVFVGWLAGRDVQLLTLDGEGRVHARSSLSLARREVYRAELLVGVDGVSLAVNRLFKRNWEVVEVRANGRLGRRRVVPGSEYVGLLGAPLDDGLALFNLSDSVDYVTTGGYGFHNWETTARVGFVAAPGGDPGWREVAAKRGDGSEGSHVRVLTRQGAAAVLHTWHEGISSVGSAARFVPLRVPCPADAGYGPRDR